MARGAGPGRFIALAAAHVLATAASSPVRPEEARPSVMLMSGLPLVWGEAGPFDPRSKPAAAYAELSEEFDFRPVDVLDGPALERGRLLFLAQPQRLAPAELAALDGWIRRGGRALILTDPMLTWPSGLPPGDIRRPPPVGLLAPLLSHWRLALESPAEARELESRWNGRRILLDSPGRFRSLGGDCVVAPEGWTAVCSLGRGTVRLVADADLMRDSLSAAADNAAIVGEWLDSLAGTPRERPREGRGPIIAMAALALLAAAAGIALLRRLRRTR